MLSARRNRLLTMLLGLALLLVASGCAQAPAAPTAQDAAKAVQQAAPTVAAAAQQAAPTVAAAVQQAAPTVAAAAKAAAVQPAAPAAGPGRGKGDQLKVLYWQAPTILNAHLAAGTKD